MRVAIVNDSVMAVESLRRVLVSAPDFEIAWVAYDGAEAVERCAQDVPDLILMDLIMPGMDGVEATRRIMSDSPCAILVVTATVSGNASKVFQAMGLGALDAVNTPVLGLTGDAEGKDELLTKINTVRKLITQKRPVVSEDNGQVETHAIHVSREKLVVIGASSGGPHALSTVLSALPADYPAPVVIVQHVDALFAPELAMWLNQQCALEVRLAQAGDRLVPGRVLVAGTNDHLILADNGLLKYTPEPAGQVYRPSVDVFFNSVVDNWSGSIVAVLLTGMGRDGAEGLLRIKTKGGYTVAQNEATCAVYGMPKAAVKLNAVVEELSIEDIGPLLVRRIMSSDVGG